jgi:hypothetical protein
MPRKMTLKYFLISVWPIWLTEILMTLGDHLFSHIDNLVSWGYLSLFVSTTLLPYIAGWRIRKYSNNIMWAVLAAVSFSAFAYSSTYLFFSSMSLQADPIVNFVYSWLLVSFFIQALFGALGSISRSMHAKKHNKSLNLDASR